MKEKDKKINNILTFHKKDDTNSVNDVEKDIIDSEQHLLELKYEEVVQQNRRYKLDIESIKGQILFVEKVWKDFNISEFEIQRRKKFYKDLLYGKRMTYLTNRLDAEKDENERSYILKEISDIYKKSLRIVDILYTLDFTPQQTSLSGEVESETSKSL